MEVSAEKSTIMVNTSADITMNGEKLEKVTNFLNTSAQPSPRTVPVPLRSL
ncbi:hypothetical protein DPMN_054446 [Dreissena polymorpha]|uniref:Uncharacterized protein n=1 Tax=Dreissena polymorpha TaxID=45954 RepID=A0A9D4CPM6_DREPO|nr:hypothetical protein DPMN_054446 [Dreissena polymorpha]